MRIKVDMEQFQKNWVWDADSVFYGDQIAKAEGEFFSFDFDIYESMLTEFNIPFIRIKE